MSHLITALLMIFLVPIYLIYLCLYWERLGFGKWGLLMSLLGDASNITALISNGWQMPVIGHFIYPETLWKSGLDAKLPWLCDRFPIPLVGICSIGDFLIITGAAIGFAWVGRYMAYQEPQESSRSVREKVL